MRTLQPSRALLPAVVLVLLQPVPAQASGASGPVADPPESAAAVEVVGGPQLATSGTVVAPTAPALPALSASSWLVADLDSGDVLAAKDPHGRYAPASTLKTLTALTLIPVLEPDRKVVPSYDDIAVDGSKVGLVERVGYPVEELFEALLMTSGNDAANVLASAAGGQQTTARLMNEQARALGAVNTHAVNPHGLDAEGQVSSAYDLALIARAGMAVPQFAGYVAKRTSSVSAPGAARIGTANKNKLLYHYDGALGVKNGFTSRARASFIGAAERDGRRLVVTLMRADPRVWAEAGLLLDWGFAAAAVGVPPVGELIAPADAQGEGAETPADGALEASGPVAGQAVSVAQDSPAEDGGPSWPLALTGVLVLTLSGLVARRRQVVARRRARRMAARRATTSGSRPARQATARPAGGPAPAGPGRPRRAGAPPSAGELSDEEWYARLWSDEPSAPEEEPAQRRHDVHRQRGQARTYDSRPDLGGSARRRLTS